jgi:phosphohistidine phosphatase
MSRLILMRHAKSDWTQGTEDIARPLNKRGRSAAKAIGRHLAETDVQPDRILCSPSRRTRETLAKLLPHLTGLREILFVPGLYEGMGADYLAIIRAYGADADTLMLIGHNSAMHETAVHLASASPVPEFKSLATVFPTGATAIFATEIYWSEIGPDNVRLENYILPRALQDGGESDGDTPEPGGRI